MTGTAGSPPLLAWGLIPVLLTIMPGIYVWQGRTATDPVLAADGQRLFLAKGCTGCHQLDGQGEAIACDLDRVGRRRHKAWLRQWLADPQAMRPGTTMPRPQLDRTERLAIAEFLARRQ